MAWKGKLLAAGMNAKTIKSDKSGEYITAIMYLAPDDLAIKWLKANHPELLAKIRIKTLCPFAKKAQCSGPCLNTAGMGVFSNVQLARIKKAIFYWQDREKFKETIRKDLKAFVKHCEKQGKKAAVRLNGTSDIVIEDEFADILSEFKNVQFYDYAKDFHRAYKTLPENYDLTLSYSGANPDYAAKVWKAHKDTGKNIAIVYRTKELRDQFVAMTGNVIDGDKTDLRFLDEKGKIVGLYAKGKAKKDKSGFVVD